MRGLVAWMMVVGCSAAAPSPRPPVALPLAAHAPDATHVEGTWYVELEYTGWEARPSAIAVDETGVYVSGPVFEPGNVEVRRWGIAKLDRTTGAPIWSVLDNLDNGPMPERMALAGGKLVVAGTESNYARTRRLVFERRDPTTGALMWRRTVPEASTGQYNLGSIALTPDTLLYAATIGDFKQPTASFGELALDTGKPFRAHVMRENLRGRAIATDANGVYLLGDDDMNHYSLERLDPKWKPVSTQPAGQVLQLERDAAGMVAWFRTIEQYAPDGKRAWKSQLVGDFVDVAIDASGIYACAMMDASTQAYFAIAKLDPATGAVLWSTRAAEYDESRPTSAIAVDADAIYVLGYVGDHWYVERRRKSDGAIGKVEHAVQRLEPQAGPQLAR